MTKSERTRIQDSAQALRLAAVSLRDMERGWSDRELHESPRLTAARAYRMARVLDRMTRNGAKP